MAEVMVFSNPPTTEETLRSQGVSSEAIEHLNGRRSGMSDISAMKGLLGAVGVGGAAYFGSNFAKEATRKFFLDSTVSSTSGKAFGLVKSDKGRVASHYVGMGAAQAATGAGVTMLTDWAVRQVDGKLGLSDKDLKRMKMSGYVGTAASILGTVFEFLEVKNKTIASVKVVEEAKIAGKPKTKEEINALGAYFEVGGMGRPRRNMGAFFQVPKQGMGAFFKLPKPQGMGCVDPVVSMGRVSGEDVVRYALTAG